LSTFNHKTQRLLKAATDEIMPALVSLCCPKASKLGSADVGVEAEDEDKTPEVRGNMADTLRVCEMVGGVAVCVLQMWVWRRKGRGWGISKGAWKRG